jgi:hypothetical protein
MVARKQKASGVRGLRVNEPAVLSKPYVGFSQPGTWTLAALVIVVLAGFLIWEMLRAPGKHDGKFANNPKNGDAQLEAHQGSDSPTGAELPTPPTLDNVLDKEKQNPEPERPRNQSSSMEGLLIAKVYHLKKPSNLPGDESDEHLDEQARGTTGEETLSRRWRIVGPMTTLVRSVTPQFRWSSTEPADYYQVSIYDDAFNLIDSSGPIRTTWWKTSKQLKRGQEYRWMVTAEKDGKEIFAAPPRGAAFKVIDEQELIELQTKLRGTRSRVARSIIYAEAGLLEEGMTELQRHLECHPHDKRATELVKRIRSWHN